MLDKLLAKNIVVQNRISQLKIESNNISKYDINSRNELNITNNVELNNISKYSNNGIKITEQNINNKNLFNNEYNKSKIKISDIEKEKLTISQINTNIKYQSNLTNKTNKINNKTKIDYNSNTLIPIKEIFNFYCCQHNLIGSKGLFEDEGKSIEHLTSSDFYKFCVEYNIPITRQKSLDTYKKSLSTNLSTYNKSRLNEF